MAKKKDETATPPTERTDTQTERVDPATTDVPGIEVKSFDLEAAFGALGVSVASLEDRIAALERRVPTRDDLLHLMVQLRGGDRGERVAEEPTDRPDVPARIRVRTRDGRARHHRAGVTVGRGWREIETTPLTDAQLRDLIADPLVEIG